MSENLPTIRTNIERSVESDILFVDKLFDLGRIAVQFARVERAPRLPDGRRETDVEHSFHLSLSAVEVAAQYFPHLDVGLVGLFGLVHDLPEVKTLDVWTFEISPEERAAKEAAEKVAAEELCEELPPFLASLLRRYEEQTELEARLVRFVDKSMPAIINTLADEACTFREDHNVYDVETLRHHRLNHTERLIQMFPDFPEFFGIRRLISERMEKHFFPDPVLQSDQ